MNRWSHMEEDIVVKLREAIDIVENLSQIDLFKYLLERDQTNIKNRICWLYLELVSIETKILSNKYN